jgi:hypothetical protein
MIRGRLIFNRRLASGLVVLVALLAALALAGCGGSSGNATAAGSTGGSASPGTSEFIVKSDDAVTKGEATEIKPAFYPNGHDTDEENASGKQRPKPCSLVSVRQAEGILGGGVSRSEHLQGPTCIFTGSGREVSLSLQEVSLKQLRKGARKATAVTVGSHKGWCLRYEKTSVAVSIHPNEVLVVGGPCQAGVRFAAFALAML